MFGDPLAGALQDFVEHVSPVQPKVDVIDFESLPEVVVFRELAALDECGRAESVGLKDFCQRGVPVGKRRTELHLALAAL